MNSLTAIQDDPRNADTINILLEQMGRRQGVIPFVGAGLSYSFGFPLWGPFLIQVSEKAGIADVIRAAVKAGRFEAAAQTLKDLLGKEFDNQIALTFGTTSLPKISPQAVHALPELANGPVITTNFDRVLETVFRNAGRAFDLALWGARVQLALGWPR